MIKLVHISDLHLAPLPPVRWHELLSKRITGYANWRFKRAHHMHAETLNNLIAHMRAQKPDMIAITGDMVNLASAAEIENKPANGWKISDPPSRIAVIPGNHDAYVRGSVHAAQKRWGAYMAGDTLDANPYPYIRRIGDVAIIGCSSAVARPPFIASGKFDAEQAERLAHCLKIMGEEGLFRVVMIHHPPIYEYARSFSKGLAGAEKFRDIVAQYGAELVLHGHLHESLVNAIDGPNGEVPVIGVAAASSDASLGEHPARYNLFSIEQIGSRWSCSLKEYGYQRIGNDIVLRLQMRLY